MKTLSTILLFLVLINISCNKGGFSGSNPFLVQYFETNVLNSKFVVSLAKNNGTDITSNYSGYVFVLLKTDDFQGPLQATKNGTTYTGTWSTNSDYSKLTITLPSTPAEFNFLNRAWRFTSKDLPTMKLAPWGSTAAVALNMTRQ